ncbi:unnamed protein product, partial [Medioppia subpectinata]
GNSGGPAIEFRHDHPVLIGTVSYAVNCSATQKNASLGAHPWVVVVLQNNRHHCTGSILNDKWVMTAAHCFNKSDPTSKPSNFTIRTGTLLRLDGNEYPVAKIVQHPQWNYWGFKNSDIALMKINGTIDMGENIKPIDLPKTLFEEPVREHVIVAGWGKRFLNSSVTLLLANEFKLNVIPNGRCAQAYTTIQYMTYKSQLCTWNRNQTVCEGNSGGPAVEYRHDLILQKIAK